jgi:hypothetical protein
VSYSVVLKDKYDISDFVESIVLADSLDQIAYRADIRLVESADFAKLGIDVGQPIRIIGKPHGSNNETDLFPPAVIWDFDRSERKIKRRTITAYDRTIYLQKSEDEFLFPADQTASQRLKIYAEKWGIPLGSIPNTGIPLAKARYYPRSLYSMIKEDLQETVKKGGKMFRPRMTRSGLELFQLGSNKTIWILERGQNIEELEQSRTLEGAITQVKVVGKMKKDKRAPVLAVVKGETQKYGTLQKVLSDDKIKTAAQANAAGKELLTGVQETFTVTSLDINSIRAGELVELDGKNLIVMYVRHELGQPGHMTLQLASEGYVKRRYYL